MAHGGVSVDDDVCILRAGAYKAHFTGYLPTSRGSKEFCEDIPGVGPIIIVLDYVDAPLRDLSVDFRIVRDVNRIGNRGTWDDLGGEAAIEAATVMYVPPQVYPAGTITVRHRFDEPGRFIGVVTAQAGNGAPPIRSVFPFAVGITRYWPYVKVLIGILLLAGGMYWFSERHHRNKRDAGGKT